MDVYGQHTGALIAVELAIQRPELVHRTVLDGVLILSEEERDELLRRYTPPFTPRDDGTHLLAAWHMVRNQNLFWPWFNNTRSGIRRVEPLDAHRLHEAFVDLMKSGETYPISYRAAFSYPTVERLAQLATPVLMIARETDPLPELTQRASALARNAELQRFAGDDRALAAMIGRFLAVELGFSPRPRMQLVSLEPAGDAPDFATLCPGPPGRRGLRTMGKTRLTSLAAPVHPPFCIQRKDGGGDEYRDPNGSHAGS